MRWASVLGGRARVCWCQSEPHVLHVERTLADTLGSAPPQRAGALLVVEVLDVVAEALGSSAPPQRATALLVVEVLDLWWLATRVDVQARVDVRLTAGSARAP